MNQYKRTRQFLAIVLSIAMLPGLIPISAEATTLKTMGRQSIFSGSAGQDMSVLPVLLTADESPFAGGDGSSLSPYQIAEPGQLAMLAELVNEGNTEYNGKYYQLTADIDLSGYASADSGAGWTPIGFGDSKPSLGDGMPFKGNFDGNNHTVSGLYINRPGVNYQGLFGCVNSGGMVQNLGVVNAEVRGSSKVGGVAGMVSEGTVQNCYNTGSINSSSPSDYVGGVAGIVSNGTVQNCYNTGSVSGGGHFAGGVVGEVFYGTMKNCYNTGSVSGRGYYTGGVAGTVAGGTAQSCYNRGNVSGESYVGGISGDLSNSDSSIKNCYSIASVTGTSIVGGIVGRLNMGTAENCYTTGKIKGNGSQIGGIVGEGYGTVKNCAALNYRVTGTDKVSRVSGSHDVSENDKNKYVIVNNYAFDLMTGGGTNTGLNGLDGESLTIEQANSATFWTAVENWNTAAWDTTSIWTITDGKLPVLKDVGGIQPENGLQTPPQDITGAIVTVSGSYTYTGYPIIPVLNVTFGGAKLKENVDYTIAVTSGGTNAGNAKAKITGIGNFDEEIIDVSYTINKAVPTAENLEYDLTDQTYNGLAKSVNITAKTGFSGLGTIGTVYYDSSEEPPVNAGAYDVTVDIEEGTNYAATTISLLLGSLHINKAVPTAEDLEYDLTAQTYNGSAKTVNIAAKAGIFGLGTIGTVYYDSSEEPPVNAGAYEVTIDIEEGTNYAATTTSLLLGSFRINKAVPTAEDLEYDLTGQTYNGLAKTVNIAARAGISGLGTIGTVYYDGSAAAPVNVGTYNVTVNIAEGVNYAATTTSLLLGSLHINKALLSITGGTVAEKTFDNTAAATVNSVSFSGLQNNEALTLNIDYTVTNATFDNADAGTGKTVTGTVALTNSQTAKNYTLTGSELSGVTGKITEVSAPWFVSPGTADEEKKIDQPVAAETELASTAGTGGSANAVIPDKAITDAIAKAQADAKDQSKKSNGINVSVVLSNPAKTKSLSVVLTQPGLKQLTDDEIRQFEIEGQLLALNFDQTALQEIRRQSTGNVTITVKPVKVSGVSNTYDITVSFVKKGKTVNITSLGKGEITLSIPYTPDKNKTVGYLYAVYVNDKGKVKKLTDSFYDANSGSIIFTTNHFSVYGVGYTAPKSKFTDTSKHWAKDSIDYVVRRGLLSGTSDKNFSPDKAISRGVLAAALGSLAGVDVKLYTTGSFSDVAADEYYAAYIEWAHKKGIIQGISDSRFAPDKEITREEMAVILTRFAKATGYTLPVTREAVAYADAFNIGNTCKTAVTAMQQAGIMMGGSGNKFNSKQSVTRAETSAMLQRYIKLTIDPDTAQGWALNDAGEYQYYKEGVMIAGKWLEIDGKWYYFYTNGALALSTRVDGYEVGADGARKQ